MTDRDTSFRFVAASRAGSSDGANSGLPRIDWSKPGSRKSSAALAVYLLGLLSEYATVAAGASTSAARMMGRRLRRIFAPRRAGGCLVGGAWGMYTFGALRSV